MKKLEFKTSINAPKNKVWSVLWNDDTYRKWTSVFSEGSYAVTDWKEGSKVHFLTPKGDGMYSVVNRNVPNEYMSFKHLGIIKEGNEMPQDEETKKWSGSMENYYLSGNGATELRVELDAADEHAGYFAEIFPKALQKVKELSES